MSHFLTRNLLFPNSILAAHMEDLAPCNWARYAIMPDDAENYAKLMG